MMTPVYKVLAEDDLLFVRRVVTVRNGNDPVRIHEILLYVL